MNIPKKILKACNITRITDVTHLDVLGIPVYTAYRPNTPLPGLSVISVYNGKGFTKKEARTGAIMEAVERHCGDRMNAETPFKISTTRAMQTCGCDFIPPQKALAGRPVRCRAYDEIEWVRGNDLFTERAVWVPACAVFSPYRVPVGAHNPGGASSNGLASSSSRLRAVVTALLECVERYSVARAEKTGRSVLVQTGGSGAKRLLQLTDSFHRQGITLVIKDITVVPEIPAFFAVCDDPHTRNPLLLNRGQAAHWSARTAMIKAVLEAAQGRLTVIQGAREDLEWQQTHLTTFGYDRLRNKEFSFFYNTTGMPVKSVTNYRQHPRISLQKALRHILCAIKRSGFGQAIVVDLSLKSVKIPVVKVIIPSMRI